MPSALATMATWLCPPVSSMMRPRSRRAIVVEQIGGPHAARHQNSVVRQLGGDGVSPGPTGQDAQQAVRQLVEVAQSFVPIGLGLAQHAHPGVVLHALDGGFRRHAPLDGALSCAEASRGRARTCGRPQEYRDARRAPPARPDPSISSIDALSSCHGDVRRRSFLLAGLLGLELGHHHPRLVQARMAKRQAFGERLAANDVAEPHG